MYVNIFKYAIHTSTSKNYKNYKIQYWQTGNIALPILNGTVFLEINLVMCMSPEMIILFNGHTALWGRHSIIKIKPPPPRGKKNGLTL